MNLRKEKWLKFLESTKYKNLGETDEKKGLIQPPLELTSDSSKSVVDLPSPLDIQVASIDLRKAIEDRKSVRKYLEKPLSMNELSWLLWCTQGVKQITKRPSTIRTVPSAGARHPFETYLVVNRVNGLEPGLYRFLATRHKLTTLDLDDTLVNKFSAANWSSDMLSSSAVIFIWVAISNRMTYKYGNRGFRYLHLDAGHVCQNLYLATEAIECGTCAVGGFYDDEVNALLNFDEEEKFVVYMATVGKKGNMH
jgi:SagB-type dehydrogenase family enzyme